jgi:pilus assembly protein CpaB
MKPKTMILMIVAVVCGLGASYLTSRLLAEREDQPAALAAPPPVEKVTLIVAKKPLQLGVVIKDAHKIFAEKTMVKEDAPKEVVTDWKGLEGKTLKRPLRAGDHVFLDDLRDGPVTLEVPPGHRAIGLRVTVDAIAAGFASLPGSKVDILWNRRGNNDDQTFSMKLLQNVLVLAADTTDATIDGSKAIPASVVTLALTPKDSERVSLASESGTLRLILRRPDDETVDSKSKPTRLADIGKEPTKEEETAKLDEFPPDGGDNPPPVTDEKWEPIPPPVVRRHTVWIREGDRIRKEVFDLPDEDDRDDETTDTASQPFTAEAPPQPEPPPAPAIGRNRDKGG